MRYDMDRIERIIGNYFFVLILVAATALVIALVVSLAICFTATIRELNKQGVDVNEFDFPYNASLTIGLDDHRDKSAHVPTLGPWERKVDSQQVLPGGNMRGIKQAINGCMLAGPNSGWLRHAIGEPSLPVLAQKAAPSTHKVLFPYALEGGNPVPVNPPGTQKMNRVPVHVINLKDGSGLVCAPTRDGDLGQRSRLELIGHDVHLAPCLVPKERGSYKDERLYHNFRHSKTVHRTSLRASALQKGSEVRG